MSNKHKDYTRYSKEPAVEKKVAETMTPEVIEEAVEKVLEPVQKPTVGVVTDCARLNVRKEPHADAEVAFVIDASTDLMVYVDESTEDFYKICTAAGTEGYCMKRYITLVS